MAGSVQGVEVVLEQTSSLSPSLTIRHKTEQPVKSDSKIRALTSVSILRAALTVH